MKPRKIKELKIPFGGDCPEIEFSQEKWQEHYGPNGHEDESLKKMYADKMNKERVSRGLSPIHYST